MSKGHFPPWQPVYYYFSKWSRDGSLTALNEALVMARRQRCGLSALPTTLIVDSQSVKNAATATRDTGVDGGKKIKGRKRLVLTDEQGNLLAVRVFEANRHDGTMAARWWEEWISTHPLFAHVVTIKGDEHFGGQFRAQVEQAGKVTVIISKDLVGRPAQSTMPVHKNRWVVERTFAWEDNSRRLSKDYERTSISSQAFIILSSISRIARNQIQLR